MLKRIVSLVLATVFALLLPIAIVGCEDEVKTQRHVEVKDQVIDQHTVVK